MAATFQTMPIAQLSDLSADDRAQIRAIGCLFDPLGGEQMDMLPNLEIISSFGVGYDHIDADVAAKRGVIVTHTPGVLDDEVADTAIGLLLNTLRELPRAEAYLRAGRWAGEGTYPLTQLTLRERTVGIFGLGRIGQAIARRLTGFGVDVHYHNRRPVDGIDHTYHSDLDSLADACDTIINVVPATAETQGIINADIFNRLGPNGVFINVGRGTTVNETDLIAALEQGTIAAAGLDVYTDEPNVPQGLLDAPNTVLLPHVASASEHTRIAMGNLVVDNLITWFTQRRVLTSVPETAHLTP
ncbi:MAG: 2-hydroxyacid dehydrogenase [Pseudomonadota bacterium]